MFDLEEELKKLPAKPGVYIMHDNIGTIIYVGKAKRHKNRLGAIISFVIIFYRFFSVCHFHYSFYSFIIFHADTRRSKFHEAFAGLVDGNFIAGIPVFD